MELSATVWPLKTTSGFDNYVHITQPDAKTVPNCDVSFANGELHQACGHVTLWSRAHRQRHVTTCLMTIAVGERNIAIGYSFCVWLCNMNIVIAVSST